MRTANDVGVRALDNIYAFRVEHEFGDVATLLRVAADVIDREFGTDGTPISIEFNNECDPEYLEWLDVTFQSIVPPESEQDAA